MGTILQNARILDGRGEALERGFVTVEGNRIVKMGKGPGPGGGKGDEVVDLSGRTLLPGIIDCHVHLTLNGSPDPIAALQQAPPPITLLKAAKHAHLTLLAGITTLRDLGAKDHLDIHLRNGVRMGLTKGPRILCSGRLVCMTGGQGWPFGREADGPDEVRKAVREQLRAGADVIKLMATGGVLTPGMEAGAPQLTYEELRAGVEEAHKAGRKTASHAQGNEGIKNALKAGIDSIEHGFSIDDEAIELFLDRKAALVPTLAAPFHILEKGLKSGIPAFAIEKTERVNDEHLASFKRAHRAGVTIAMGTDAGTPFNHHGENMKELELLVRSGFTPMEAIIASTGRAASILGMEKEIGTIEEGKLADLIVIEGDPLQEIAVLQEKGKIVIIMKDGEFFKKTI